MDKLIIKIAVAICRKCLGVPALMIDYTFGLVIAENIQPIIDINVFADKQFAQREEWTMLCDTLASKLMKAGNTLAATLCYICAGNIDKTVEIWSRSLAGPSEGKSYVDLLQVHMELPKFI